MITKEEVAETVRNVLETTLKVAPDKIQPQTMLRDELNLDSLDMMEVVCELEERFDVQIPEEKVMEVVTFEQVVDRLHATISGDGA